MAKGTARKRREIRQLKHSLHVGVSLLADEDEDECIECGGDEFHAEWCLADEEDDDEDEE